MDFNLIMEDSGKIIIQYESMVKKALSLGYENVALNTIISPTQLQTKGFKITEPKDMYYYISGNKNKKVLTRVTAIVENNLQAHHFMQNPTTKEFDIIAIQPTDEKLLQHVCTNMDVDIICLDFSKRLNFTLKKTYLGAAIRKGICFEILYSPCLRDRTSRRLTICNSHILLSATKGKNVILSSGAEDPLELRGVEDVANLGVLFGFKTNQAKDAVRKTGKIVLSHSGTRNKTGCGFVSVQEIFKVAKKDRWLLEACKIPKEYNLSTEAMQSKKRSSEDDEEKKCKIKINE